MGVYKTIHKPVKVGRRYTFPDFAPTPAAYLYDQFEGKTATLYAVQGGGFIKLGFSTQFDKRFKSLSHACPFPLSKVCSRSVPMAGVTYAEAWLHDFFQEKCVKGEWFSITALDAKMAMKKAVKIAEVYSSACREWYAREYERRSLPEYQERAVAAYEECLQRYNERVALYEN